VKGVLIFGLVAALVAGIAMAVTLDVGHQLGHAWRLSVYSAGAGGLAGALLAGIAHLLTRAPKSQTE
jgi:hypothetical protein